MKQAFQKSKYTLASLLAALFLFYAATGSSASVLAAGESTPLRSGLVLEQDGNVFIFRSGGVEYLLDLSGAEKVDNGLSLAIGCHIQVQTGTALASGRINEVTAYQVTRPAVEALNAATGGTEQERAVASVINGMTLEEQVAQLLLVSCDLSEASRLLTENYTPGGFLFNSSVFALSTKEGILSGVASLSRANDGVALWFGTTEEGGAYSEVSANASYADSVLSTVQEQYADGGLDNVEKTATRTAQLLSSMGLNLNLSPFLNVSADPADAEYSRSLGQGIQTTAQYVSRTVKASQAQDVEPILKYFPGYGTLQENGLRVDSITKDEINDTDVTVYQAGVDAGANAVMVANTIISCLDDTKPATLSSTVLTKVRNEVGFTGVLIAENGELEALLDYTDESSAVVACVKAGCDMVVVTDFEAAYEALYYAVSVGNISQRRLLDALSRCLLWKSDAGLIR